MFLLTFVAYIHNSVNTLSYNLRRKPMASTRSETLTKRISASVTEDEHERFIDLCKSEGRNGRQQIMHMVAEREGRNVGDA